VAARRPGGRYVLPYFLTYANDEQRERWLPGIASGELITAVAMTEPGMGSDLASMATTAIRGSFQQQPRSSGLSGDLVDQQCCCYEVQTGEHKVLEPIE